MTVTKVFEQVPGRARRLIHKIDYGSVFHSMPWTKKAEMGTEDNQRRAAIELVGRWKVHKPNATYTVEQDGRTI